MVITSGLILGRLHKREVQSAESGASAAAGRRLTSSCESSRVLGICYHRVNQSPMSTRPAASTGHDDQRESRHRQAFRRFPYRGLPGRFSVLLVLLVGYLLSYPFVLEGILEGAGCTGRSRGDRRDVCSERSSQVVAIRIGAGHSGTSS